MTRSEFDEIDPAERAHSMLKTLVVADEDEATVSTILRHYDAALDGKISQEKQVCRHGQAPRSLHRCV